MADEAKDKLFVKGLGSADGTYEFDLNSLLNIGFPDALDNREQHRIRLSTGVRGGEIQDAVLAADAAVMVALVGIILARHGKTVNEERIWNTRFLYAFSGLAPSIVDYPAVILLEVVDRRESDEGDDVSDPPAVAPLQTEQPSTSGGASLRQTSDHPANGQSPTGLPDSARSATSVRVTSEI